MRNQITKIEAALVSGFVDIIYINEFIQLEKLGTHIITETQQKYKTLDIPTLQERILKVYATENNTYSTEFLIDNLTTLRNLKLAKYLKLTFWDGTVLNYIHPEELTIEEIPQSGTANVKFRFSELYLNRDGETSYLTYPEIGSTYINRLQYYKSKLYDSLTIVDLYGNTIIYYDGTFTDSANYITGNEVYILTAGGVRLTGIIDTDLGSITITGIYSFTEFYVVKYIFTQIVPIEEIVPGTHSGIDLEELNEFTKVLDYKVIKSRFWLKLAQKNDLVKLIHLQPKENIVFITDSQEYTSIEMIDAKTTVVDGVPELFTYDMEFKYLQLKNGV